MLHYVNNEVNRELFVILESRGVEVGVFGIAFVSVNLREGLYALRELCSVETSPGSSLSLYEIFPLSEDIARYVELPYLKSAPPADCYGYKPFLAFAESAFVIEYVFLCLCSPSLS